MRLSYAQQNILILKKLTEIMRNKGSIYLRRLRPSDKADDMRTAYAMVLYKYGAFRRGYPGICIMAAQSKRRIKEKFKPNSWEQVKRFFKETVK